MRSHWILAVAIISSNIFICKGSSWEREHFHTELTIPEQSEEIRRLPPPQAVPDAPEEPSIPIKDDQLVIPSEMQSKSSEKGFMLAPKDKSRRNALVTSIPPPPRPKKLPTTLYDPFQKDTTNNSIFKPTGSIEISLPSSSSHNFYHNNFNNIQEHTPTDQAPPPTLQVTIDPASTGHLCLKLLQATAFTASAFLGSSRMLTPLVVVRRSLKITYDAGSDWYRGRALRTTYHQGRQLWNKYHVPATIRSVSRVFVHVFLMTGFGTIMEWFLGVDNGVCHREETGGCWIGCSLLWMYCVLTLSYHSMNILMERITPLMLQEPKARGHTDRPHRILWQWLQDPDQWLRFAPSSGNSNGHQEESESLKTFEPDARLFPATWKPVRVMLLVTLAAEMTRNSKVMQGIMTYTLFQQALEKEWNRSLLQEKRVALGMILASVYFLATAKLVWIVANASSVAALLSSPSLLAAIITLWMNVFIFFDRRQENKNIATRQKARKNMRPMPPPPIIPASTPAITSSMRSDTSTPPLLESSRI